MKALINSILLFAASLIGLAANTEGPQFRAEVVCHNGKLDSGSFCKSNASRPGTAPEKSGRMTCGFPGKVSELTWTFVERRDGKDVYDFARRFPIKSEDTATQTKRVQFGGKRVTVFEDKSQVIVIQSARQ